MDSLSIINGFGPLEAKVEVNASHYKEKENRYALSDIRLEDIPKDVLLKYGIILNEEDYWKEEERRSNEKEGDGEEEGRLVIDEDGPMVLVQVPALDDRQRPLKSRNPRVSFGTYYQCCYKDCKEGFGSADHKWRHEVLHCDMCFELQPDRDTLLRHRAAHCPFKGCLDLLENAEERERHRKMHQHEKPFMCRMCRRRFRYYHCSKKHSQFCKVAKRSYACEICNTAFRKLSHYEKHKSRHMNMATGVVPCHYCKRTYRSWKVYNKHLYKHHDQRLQFCCLRCSRSFLYHESLMRHLKCHDIIVTDSDLHKHVKVEIVFKDMVFSGSKSPADSVFEYPPNK